MSVFKHVFRFTANPGNSFRNFAGVLTFGLIRRADISTPVPPAHSGQMEACLVHVDGAFEDTRAQAPDNHLASQHVLHGVLVL